MPQNIQPIDWWMIALANCIGTNGINKGTWDERIEFGKKFVGEWTQGSMDVEAVLSGAKEEYITYKTLRALKDMLAGKETTFCMPLDASASGPAIMGVLTGCEATMRQTNTIHTGEVQDLYPNTLDWMIEYMYKKLNIEFDTERFTRKAIKNCVMTTNYNSSAASKSLFGEDTPEYEAFHQSREILTPGCTELLTHFNQAWNPNWTEYEWTNIAGQRCVVQTQDKSIDRDTGRRNDKKILRIQDIYDYDGSFSYQYTERSVPCGYYIPLAANLIQGTDGGIKSLVQKDCREDKKHHKGFDILTVHDEFWAHPNNMSELCDSYRRQLAYMFKQNHLQDLLSDLYGKPIVFTRKCDAVEGEADRLHDLILQSEYAIC